MIFLTDFVIESRKNFKSDRLSTVSPHSFLTPTTMADILVAHPESHSGLYTCLSCTIAFHTAQDQREYFNYRPSTGRELNRSAGEHYRSDHHRYNMKRRVAGLPPVSAAVFNQKVLERRAETAIMASPKGSTCEICGSVQIFS